MRERPRGRRARLCDRRLACCGIGRQRHRPHPAGRRVRRGSPVSARRTIVLVALAAAVVSAAVVTARLATSHWDASAFVRAGNVYAHPGQTPENLTVINGIGYDGQFYYRLALDPFSGARTKFGITLD